jgi:predicted phosphodiesterase
MNLIPAKKIPAKKIGLIGDVHSEDGRLALAIEFLQQFDLCDILCTGDIADGPGCPDTSIELLAQAGVKTVRGNHDRWLLEDKARHVPNAHTKCSISARSIEYLENLPTQIELNTIAGNLLLCHGIGDNDLKKVWPGTERMAIERSLELDQIIASGDYRMVINGHMHFKTVINFASLTLLNAGTITGERWPTFSLIDFEAWQIETFEFRENTIIKSSTTSLSSTSDDVLWQDTQNFTGGWRPVLLTGKS